jgi:alcohol dehydrogenase
MGELLSGGTRWRDMKGAILKHHLGVSAFAEYVVISIRSAVRIAADIRPEIAALFGCAVMTGVGAIVNTARVVPGESVAVFGLGGVGLAALMGARAAGANPIFAVDVNQEKLDLARILGAHECIDARDGDVVAAIRKISNGGVHYAVESAGNEVVLEQAYGATRRGGTTVAIGLAGVEKKFSVSAVSLVAEERTVKGSYMGSAVPSRDLPRFTAMYHAGLLPVDKLLTHTLKLEEINAGFDRLHKGEGIRQVVLFD